MIRRSCRMPGIGELPELLEVLSQCAQLKNHAQSRPRDVSSRPRATLIESLREYSASINLDMFVESFVKLLHTPSPTGDTGAALKVFEKTIAGRHPLWTAPAKSAGRDLYTKHRTTKVANAAFWDSPFAIRTLFVALMTGPKLQDIVYKWEHHGARWHVTPAGISLAGNGCVRQRS